MFDTYVSLGWFCGMAGSLSKNGYRSFSAPFDWYFSNFRSVISQIDNDFIDFMQRDNLVVVEDKPTEFKDIKYDFYCNHDVKKDFNKEYLSIYEKYMYA